MQEAGTYRLATARRRSALRLRRRAALVEAVLLRPSPPPVAGAPRRGRLRRRRGGAPRRRAWRSSARAPATSTRSPSRTAPSSTGARRPGLRRAAARRVRRRGQLRAGGGHLLLRVDGDRAAGDRGFDLALTELLDGRIASWSRSARRAAPAPRAARARPRRRTPTAAAADAVVAAHRRRRWAGRSTPTDIKELLYRNAEHPRWDDVAARCLTCANCTLVCPTCFCSTVEDVTDLTGDHAERWRTLGLVLHARPLLPPRRQRARHRRARATGSGSPTSSRRWIDQFGTSGCVGCGRCITWCPVGIDLTEEVAAIRASDAAAVPSEGEADGDARARSSPSIRSSSASPPRIWRSLVGCARNVRFDAGEFLFRAGEEANQFFLAPRGTVALEIALPGRAPLVARDARGRRVLGWSWLIPPYHWKFDARRVEPTRALALDGKCLRGKCEADHDLGYELLKRFAQIIEERLQATRLQLLDVYGATVAERGESAAADPMVPAPAPIRRVVRETRGHLHARAGRRTTAGRRSSPGSSTCSMSSASARCPSRSAAIPARPACSCTRPAPSAPSPRRMRRLRARRVRRRPRPVRTPWPLDAPPGEDVVLVAGGIGLAPLRPRRSTTIAARRARIRPGRAALRRAQPRRTCSSAASSSAGGRAPRSTSRSRSTTPRAAGRARRRRHAR